MKCFCWIRNCVCSFKCFQLLFKYCKKKKTILAGLFYGTPGSVTQGIMHIAIDNVMPCVIYGLNHFGTTNFDTLAESHIQSCGKFYQKKHVKSLMGPEGSPKFFGMKYSFFVLLRSPCKKNCSTTTSCRVLNNGRILHRLWHLAAQAKLHEKIPKIVVFLSCCC